MKQTDLPEDRVVRMGECWAMLGVSKRTLYYLIAKGDLPKPLAMSPRTRGYRVSTLRAFMASREGAAA